MPLPRRESKSVTWHTAFAVEGDQRGRPRGCACGGISPSMRLNGTRSPERTRIPSAAAPIWTRGCCVVDQHTFADDSLRVLRALQFAARFQLTFPRKPARSSPAFPSTICRPSGCGVSWRRCSSRHPAAVLGFALATRARGGAPALARDGRADRCANRSMSGIPGGRVDHTLMVSDQARERIRRTLTHAEQSSSCWARSATISESLHDAFSRPHPFDRGTRKAACRRRNGVLDRPTSTASLVVDVQRGAGIVAHQPQSA